MRSAVVALLAVSAAVAACRSTPRPSSPSPAPPGGPTTAQAPATAGGPGGPGGRPRPSPAALDSMRRGVIARVLRDIAGREDQPAGDVFKNVKLFKALPARALLDTMNAYGRALGAGCNGCHVAGEWDKDARTNKVIARQMQQMVADLNARTLPGIKELDEDRPNVTCAMCHAGSNSPRAEVALTPTTTPAPRAP